MNPSEISAVVVTKGDRDISEVTDTLRDFGELLVWNNAESIDLKVFGRWVAAEGARSSHVFTCDDDTIVDTAELCSLYADPDRVLVNMPKRWHNAYQGTGICLVGFGCIFPRHLAMAGFWKYEASSYERDEVFLREADRVWTHSLQHLIDWAEVPIRQMPYSSAPGRMYLERRTAVDYAEIRRRIATL